MRGLRWRGRSGRGRWLRRPEAHALCAPRNDEGGRRRVMLRPHPEERPLGRVSKDGREFICCVHPSRRGEDAAPQDEVYLLFDAGKSLSSDLHVQPPSQKYFGSLLTQITSSSSPSPPDTEGRFAIVTNVGQGMRWTRVALLTRALICGRRSRVVLTPRRWRQALEKQASWGRRWQTSPVTGESAK